MQSLPIPAPASSSTHSGQREDTPAATRRDDGFAERLQERAPKERPQSAGPDKAERAEKTQLSRRPTTDASPGKPIDHASETTAAPAREDSDAPADVPAVDHGDVPLPITTAVITPDSTLAEALLALVGTTSAAINPTPTTATDQDPLLAALATLLGELPDAQALPAADGQGLTGNSGLPTDNVPPMAPSLLALLSGQEVATSAAQAATDATDTATNAAALLTTGIATTGSKATATTTDTAIAAGLADGMAATATAGVPVNADDVGDQAAQQQAPAPVLPVAAATAATDEDVPFTIAEPRAAGETAGAKPAAAPVARAAPEAGNPMERAVANQVSRALIRESADGSRMISLRLTPPELGTVRIDIVERAGVMTARLHAEDAGVRVALERYLPQLRQDLLAHNAPVRELQLADAWAGDLTRQNHSDQQGRASNRRGGRSGFSLDGVAAVAVGASAPAMTTSTITADSVDARA